MDVAATACSKPACSSFRLATNSSLTRPLQEIAVSSRAPCPSVLGGQQAADHASATSSCRLHVRKGQLRFRPIRQLGLQCQAAGRPFSAHGKIVERRGLFGSLHVTELGTGRSQVSDANRVYRAAILDGPLRGVNNQVSASCSEEEGFRGACNGSEVPGPLLMEKLVSRLPSLCMADIVGRSAASAQTNKSSSDGLFMVAHMNITRTGPEQALL